MRWMSRALIITLVGTSTSGCYSTWDLAPRELNKLAGYRMPDRVTLVDKDGEALDFDCETELRVRHGDGSPTDVGPLGSIDIKDSVLSGKPCGCNNGGQVTLYVDQVTAVEARRYSTNKTMAYVAASTMGTIALAAAVAGLVALAQLRPEY